MPYSRKYRSRNPRSNRRKPSPPWYAKKYSAMDVASLALKKASRLKALLNVEYKHHDVVTNTQLIQDTPSIQSLTAVSQGDTTLTRDGNSVKMTSLYVKGTLTLNATGSSDVCRVMLVRSKRPTAPTASVIFDTTSTLNEVFSFRNINATDYVDVLYDRCFSLTDSGSNKIVPLQIYLNKKMHLKWDVGTDTASYGHIYLVLCGTNPAAGSAGTIIDYQSRLRFVDN